MAEQRDIKYVNKEFSDFRGQLIEHAKNYFPDTYNDFSATAPGMMFIEMAAYVGDVLSFYQDTQLQETFLTHAKDPKNLFNLAYTMGYTPKVSGVAEVELTLTQTLGATGTYKPNWSTAAAINSNATFRSTDSSQTFFLVDKPVDFNFSSSLDPTDVVIAELDGTNRPTQYTVSKKVKAFSSEIKSKTFSISTAEKFKTLTITDDNIVGVLDITDADGNIFYEVPFLGQDTIFKEDANGSSDSNLVPYVLGIRKTPRRFVARFLSNGNLNIQFGSGTTSSDDSEILPDATTVGSATNQGVRRLDYSYDPSNFLFSKAYGIAPTSDITVRYLKGGGVGANVPANTITQVSTIGGTNTGTVTVNNTQPAFGGRDGDNEDELRENSLRAFNEQSRTVTLQDYTVRSLAMPSRFGSIAKAFATQDQLVNTNIDIPLSTRTSQANEIYRNTDKPCIYISIHANGFSDEAAHGWEVYTSVGETKSDEIAEVLFNKAKAEFPTHTMRKDTRDGDADKEANFYVLQNTAMPAILSENFFMTNEAECRLLMSDEGRDRIAKIHFEMIKELEK